MADTSTIKWKVKLEADNKVTDALKEIRDELDELDKKKKKNSEGLADLAQKFFFVKEAVSTLVDGYKQLTVEFIKGDEVTQRLKNSLIAMGQFSEGSFQGLLDFAEKFKVLGIDDETIKSTLAFNTSIGFLGDNAKRASEASVVLSRALGVDVETANRQLGATLDGNAGRLSRYIPELKNLTEAQLRSGEAVDIIREKYKGFLIGNDSPSNLAKQIEIAASDMKKAFGEGFFNKDAMKDQLAFFQALSKSGLAKQMGEDLKNVVMLIGTAIASVMNGLRVMWNTITTPMFKFVEELKLAWMQFQEVSGLGVGKELANSIEQSKQKILGYQKEELEGQLNLLEADGKRESYFDKLFERLSDGKTLVKDFYAEFDEARAEQNKSVGKTKGKTVIDVGIDPKQIQNIVNATTSGLSSIISMLGTFGGVWGQIIATAINFLNKSKEEMTKFIDGLIDGIIQLPERIAENIPLIIGKVIDRLPEMLAKQVEMFFTITFTMVINSITVMLNRLPEMLSRVLGIPFWTNIAKNMYSSLMGAFKGFFEALFFGSGSESISSVIEKGGQLFNPGKNAGEEIFKVKDYATNQVAQTFEDRVNTVTTEGSKGLIRTLIDGMADVGRAIWEGLKEGLTSAWEWIKSIGSRIWEGIKDGLSSIGGNIFGGGGGSLLGGISNSIASTFGWAEGGLVGGNAPFSGNSYGNDIVPALLSPGEYVINREDMANKNLNNAAAAMGVSTNGSTVYNISVNVGSNTTITPEQLKNSVVPAIVTQLQRLSQSGQPIVSKKGVY